MKKALLLVLCLMLVATAFCACGGDTAGGDGSAPAASSAPSDTEIKSAIVGAWSAEIDGSKQGVVFNEDGTGLFSILPMTYTVEGGMVNITISAFGQEEKLSAKYEVSGKTLTLEKDGEMVTLEKTELPE